jgi:hypothetical protein
VTYLEAEVEGQRDPLLEMKRLVLVDLDMIALAFGLAWHSVA